MIDIQVLLHLLLLQKYRMINLGYIYLFLYMDISEGFLELQGKGQEQRLVKLLKRDDFLLMRKKKPLLVGLSSWNQNCQLGQSSSSATSHPYPGDKGQDLVQKTQFTTKSLCRETKLLILSFKIRHLSVFFKEQMKKKRSHSNPLNLDG